jgi:hypothetical protein
LFTYWFYQDKRNVNYNVSCKQNIMIRRKYWFTLHIEFAEIKQRRISEVEKNTKRKFTVI